MTVKTELVKLTPVVSLRGEASASRRKAYELRKQAEHYEKQAVALREEAETHDVNAKEFMAAADVLESLKIT